MSQGTLYTHWSPRSWAAKALVEYLKLDVKVVEADTSKPEYLAKFPMGRVPAFENAKGFKLHESQAVCYYLTELSQDEKVKATLIGSDINERATILKWTSFANTDIFQSAGDAWLMTSNSRPYFKKYVDVLLENCNTAFKIVDDRLAEYTYIATENISLADLFVAYGVAFTYTYFFGPEQRAKYPHVLRWFKTITETPILKSQLVDFEYADAPMKYDAPKKEKKQGGEKSKKQAAEKPKKEVEDAPPAEKKPKHPLEALGKSTFVLDEWKRKYSNEETREVALPWFWEHFNPEEYSLWKVDYKYNDELTMTFMSNNLVGGFFNRLSGSVKYMFGSLVVYGENNSNGIVGVVMVRGQDFAPAFDVAPDWESYAYTKLDATKEEDKEFINNMWAWDKPVVVEGVSKEIADGKVLK